MKPKAEDVPGAILPREKPEECTVKQLMNRTQVLNTVQTVVSETLNLCAKSFWNKPNQSQNKLLNSLIWVFLAFAQDWCFSSHRSLNLSSGPCHATYRMEGQCKIRYLHPFPFPSQVNWREHGFNPKLRHCAYFEPGLRQSFNFPTFLININTTAVFFLTGMGLAGVWLAGHSVWWVFTTL